MNVNPFSYLIEKLKDYTADKIPFNNTGTSLSSTNVESAIKEVNKTYTSFNVTAANTSGVSDCVIDTQQNYTKNGIAFIGITLHAVSNTTDINITLPNNITFKQNGIIGICGKGGRWSVSGAQYLYIKSNGLSLNNITANAYYHIAISLSANVS